MADFTSRPSCEFVSRTGGCPSLEGGFVELLAVLEGWDTLLGGRSGEKQLPDHDHMYLEGAKPFWVHASRAARAW